MDTGSNGTAASSNRDFFGDFPKWEGLRACSWAPRGRLASGESQPCEEGELGDCEPVGLRCLLGDQCCWSMDEEDDEQGEEGEKNEDDDEEDEEEEDEAAEELVQ